MHHRATSSERPQPYSRWQLPGVNPTFVTIWVPIALGALFYRLWISTGAISSAGMKPKILP